MKRIVLVFLVFFIPFLAIAQNGKFRSRISGNWNVASTWERDANGDDVYEESPSSLTPTFLDSDILVRNGHTVRVYANVTVDQVTVEATGRIVIDASSVMTVANGTGTDITNFGRVSTTAGTQLVVQAGAEYRHAKNGGELPLATWDDNSSILFNAITTAAPTNLNQGGAGFYNVVWNCSGQSTTVGLAGNLRQVRGNLTVTNTNGNLLTFATTSAPAPISVGLDFTVSGNSRVSFSSTADVTVNIGGDFNFNATAVAGSPVTTSSGTTTLTVTGDFLMNAPGGILNLSSGSGSGSLALAGNFTLTSGTLLESSSGSGFITYNGVSTQQFANSGTIQNNITHTIAVGSTLALASEQAITGVSLVVDGTIRLGSLNTSGALVTGTTLGNVRTTARTFNTGSRIVYAGAAAQFIGIGHPTSTGVITEIDNASGVTFNGTTSGNSGSTNLAIGGDLVLTLGNLTISGTSSTRNLVLSGTVTSNGNSISVNGANVNVTVNGSGAFGVFPNVGGQSFRTITVNRPSGIVTFENSFSVALTTTVTSGTLQLNGAATLNGALALGASGVMGFEGQTLTLNNDITSAGGTLSANSASTLSLTGGIVLTSSPSFSPSGNTVGTLIINKTNGGTSVTFSNPFTVSTALTISDGVVDITGSALSLSSGATLTMSSLGSIIGSSPGGGPWNLVYTQGSRTTSLEIPASGSIQSLTVNTSSGSTISLAQALTINASLNIMNSGSTFNCRNNNVAVMGSITNSGTLGAPFSTTSTGLTVGGSFTNTGTFNGNNGQLTMAGDLINNGSFNQGTGTITFNGTSSISGSVPPTFNNMIVQNSLTAPSSLTLTGSFTNNGSFNAGTGTIVFAGSSLQSISGSSTTQFNNISITNTVQPVSVRINSNQSMAGQLTLASASVFDTDGSGDNLTFTLLSSASGDAGIGVLTSSSQLPGTVTVQRYMQGKDDDYRFFSVPVSTATVAQLQDDFAVTGTFTGTSFPCTGCSNNGPSLRYYSEAVKGVFSNGYAAAPVTNGSNTEVLVTGRGYSSYMWNGASDLVMDVSGTINSGTIPFTISHTVSSPAEPTADGWNLIGNPYPSAIAWNNDGGWTRSANIDATVWVWDVLGATWKSYNADTESGDLTNGVIASGQGFWVYVTPGAASLSVSESAKVSPSGTYYRTQSTSSHWMEITLQGGASVDKAYLFDTNENIQSPKLELGIENLSISVLNDYGKELAYFSPSLEEDESRLPLSVSIKTPGVYTLSFSEKLHEDSKTRYLYDALMDSYVSLQSPYSFVVEKGMVKYRDRFFITNQSVLEENRATKSNIEFFPNPVQNELSLVVDRNVHTVQLLDSRGVLVYSNAPHSAERELISINVKNFLNGIYYLRVTDGEGNVYSQKVLKQE